jgi:hypothetical protein
MAGARAAWRRGVVLVGLLAGGLGAGLVLCEALVRLGPPVEAVYGDYEVGFGARPHRVLDYPFDEHPDGHFWVRWNNLGLRRDTDTTVAKPPGVCRVVLVGDSHTHCSCNNAESYAAVAEAHLGAAGAGGRHEVLNAGHGFYSPYQYYRLLVHRMAPLGPDVVVVAFYIGNDLLDLLRDEDRPSLKVAPDGRVVEAAPRFVTYQRPEARDSLLVRSQLYLKLSQTWSSLVGLNLSRAWMIYEGVRGEGHGLGEVLSYARAFQAAKRLHGGATVQSVGQQLYFHRFPRQLERAWRINAEVLDRFVEFRRQHAVPIVFAPIPTKLQVEPDDVGALVADLARTLPELTEASIRATDDAYHQTLLAQLAARRLPVVDLRPALRAAARTGPVFYRSDFHVNVRGNAAIGRALAQWLDARRAALMPACPGGEGSSTS